jgi:hypothetical protein
MKDIDLIKLIGQANRAGKTYRQSWGAAMNILRGEDVGILCPDEETAKKFIDQVKKRLGEAKDLGLIDDDTPLGKIERIKPPKRGNR